jgi:curved DNA-binding protein CbpA
MKESDHFGVLGVKREADAMKIKMAYFALAKTWHPDTLAVDASAEVKKLRADIFAKISEAWGILGEEDKKKSYLEELASGGSSNVDVMNILKAEDTFEKACIVLKARKYEEALRLFDEALVLNPTEAEFQIWKAWTQFLIAIDKKKMFGHATTTIEAALKNNPRCMAGYLFLGQMAKINGDAPLAEKQFKRGLALNPDDAELQRELKYLKR